MWSGSGIGGSCSSITGLYSYFKSLYIAETPDAVADDIIDVCFGWDLSETCA